MLRDVLQRCAGSCLVLLAIVTFTFFLMHAIPGGPFTGEKNLPPVVLAHLEAHYHLQDPLWKQYVDYLLNLAQLDLGPSFKYEGRSVNQIIAESFPVSLQLGASALVLALGAGIPLGCLGALRKNHWQDHGAMAVAIIGMSVPSFVLATLLVQVFAVQLGWLPAALWEGPASLILPALSLAAYPLAFIARLTRSAMLEVLSQDYIRTARAKGLSLWGTVYRHALKNALLPVVTYLGPMAASILTGSFVVETIFALPGLGRHFITSIYNRDYTVILGVTVFYSVLVIVFNLVVDLLYPLLDPRIKRFEKGGN